MEPSPDLPDHVNDAVRALTELHQRHQRQAGPVQRLVHRMGIGVARPRVLFVLLCAALMWVGFNSAIRTGFDPPPFNMLANLCSVFAFLTAILILIAQRHETELANRREELTLELAILSEQKSAKLIQLLEELRRDLPNVSDRVDPEAETLAEPTDPAAVFDALKATHEEAQDDGGL